jgi:alkyl hydroperoxide reductase subunit D
MPAIDSIREKLPEAAKDLKLNLQAVLRPENLTVDQVWGVALASAYFIGQNEITTAILADAKEAGASEALIDDAKASASLMGMNTVYYRFRHLVEKEAYNTIPAKLRMMRLGQPQTDKTTFELMSMACAALAGCGMCIQAHEATLLQHGVTEAAVNDVIRIAAVLQGTTVALSIP